MPNYTVTADFDGTLFDPNLRSLLAWSYNIKTSRLLTKHKIPFILNTGRPIWDHFSDIQIAVTGMKKPDIVIHGAGTKIVWLKENKYELDAEWEKRMEDSGWDKQKVIKTVNPLLKKHKAALFDTHSPFMTRIWIYKTPVSHLQNMTAEFQKKLPGTKILRTEQILLPNTNTVFSGYLLFVPSIAGKEIAMNYVLDKLQHQSKQRLTNLAFGDALVDVSMLKEASTLGYALNPTALARKELAGTQVEICEGSPPANLLRILKSHLYPSKLTGNSPYRSFSESILSLIEPLIYPKLTPNQLSLKGLEFVQRSLGQTHLSGVFLLAQGLLMDVFDGIRARRKPELTTDDGQLIDVHADRMKEYAQLASRDSYDAALSCFLPSIARAQAEAIGKVVNEFDPSGGSALSRNIKLIKSYFYHSIGLKNQSEIIDERIFASNMLTFRNRRKQSQSFSWSKIKNYDKTAVKRLLFLVDLLQKQVSKNKIHDQNLKEALKEYLDVNIKIGS